MKTKMRIVQGFRCIECHRVCCCLINGVHLCLFLCFHTYVFVLFEKSGSGSLFSFFNRMAKKLDTSHSRFPDEISNVQY